MAGRGSLLALQRFRFIRVGVIFLDRLIRLGFSYAF